MSGSSRIRSFAAKAKKGIRVAAVPEYRRGLRRGVAASIEHSQTPLPSVVGTVVDVGANRGQFMLFALRQFPQARLICFEPLEDARATLSSLVPEDRSVTVHPFALSDSSQEREFYVTSDDDSSSLLPPSELQVATFPGARPADTQVVETRRLDDVLGAAELRTPVLLKLDVQGGELAVLEGAVATLRHVDLILVECSFVELYEGQALAPDIFAFLNDHGFELAGMFSPTIGENNQLLQADGLFKRRP